MLLPCVRAFLGEFLQQVERSEIPAKHWLGAANQVLKLTTSQRARKIADKHQINWRQILPLNAIAKSQNEKIKRFREQQLEQGYQKSKAV
jgi:protoheme ferro-lyase